MITKKDIKILWAKSAGICSFSECNQSLIVENPEASDQILGEVAHIIAKNESGPRGIPNLNPRYLNSYENLILLCPNHHRLIDSFPVKHNTEVLKEMKNIHEIRVRESLIDYGREGIGWKVILQEIGQRIDQTEIRKTLAPDLIEILDRSLLDDASYQVLNRLITSNCKIKLSPDILNNKPD